MIDRSGPGAARPPGSYVVAVCGTSGAGKSVLVDRTRDLLGHAASLHFDDYVTLGNDAGTIRDWLDAGADPDALRTPQFRQDLASLRAGSGIVSPGRVRAVAPAPVVLIEEPFGRARREMAPLIDLAVHIEVPADVALARRLLRVIAAEASPEGSGVAAILAAIDLDLKSFLSAGREAYLKAATAARASADLLLDGLLPLDELAAALAQEIHLRRGRKP